MKHYSDMRTSGGEPGCTTIVPRASAAVPFQVPATATAAGPSSSTQAHLCSFSCYFRMVLILTMRHHSPFQVLAVGELPDETRAHTIHPDLLGLDMDELKD